jgi:antitoxin HigA-1
MHKVDECLGGCEAVRDVGGAVAAFERRFKIVPLAGMKLARRTVGRFTVAEFCGAKGLGRRAAEPAARAGFRNRDRSAAGAEVAESLNDLSPLKSVGLHKLKGNREGQWAMRLNERGRIYFEFRKGDAYDVEIVLPGCLLKRELAARKLSVNRLALDIGVPSWRITERPPLDLADTAVRLGRYFGTSAQFWLDLQSQYDIAMVEREKAEEIGSGSGRRMRREPNAVALT